MSDVPSDNQLIEQFVRARCEEAFSQLVSRYIDLVYSAALRQVRRHQIAEDATQQVFAVLANKAGGLRGERVLAAWLLSTTRYVCLDLLRREGRRRQHEEKAARMRPNTTNPDQTTAEDSSLLDAALASLGEIDRRAVVLKFFLGKSDQDAADLLGLSENALRQRRFRSIEKMRQYFRQRGVDAGPEMLAGMMAPGALNAAPPHLAAEATRYALSASSAVAAAAIKGAIFMAWLKSNAVAVAAVIILLAGGAGMLIASRSKDHEPRTVAVKPAQVVNRPTFTGGFGPGQRIPALAYSQKKGVQDYPGGVGYLNTDAFLAYSKVDFGSDAAWFLALVAVPADHAGKDIVVHLDQRNGPVIARLKVAATGGWGAVVEQATRIDPVTGVHDIYLGFTGNGVANLYSLRFASDAALRPVQPTSRPATEPASRPTTRPN